MLHRGGELIVALPRRGRRCVARGQAVASPVLRARMDLNGDGRVDVIDARQLALMFTYPLGAPC